MKESESYSAMLVRELCYLYDMEKEGYEPTSDIEAVLYDLEYRDPEDIKVTGACSGDRSEYTITFVKSTTCYRISYERDKSKVTVSDGLSQTSYEEGEQSLERASVLAVLEWCACKVWGNV